MSMEMVLEEARKMGLVVRVNGDSFSISRKQTAIGRILAAIKRWKLDWIAWHTHIRGGRCYWHFWKYAVRVEVIKPGFSKKLLRP